LGDQIVDCGTIDEITRRNNITLTTYDKEQNLPVTFSNIIQVFPIAPQA
jgi:hypothetical protein